jgi:CubicO group peptidase (beta-lactamase class C family)
MRRSIVFIFFTITTLYLHAQSPVFRDDTTLPAGMAGEKVTAFIQAINSNSPQQITDFFLQHVTERFRTVFPLKSHLAVVLGIYRRTGGVDFYSVRSFSNSTDSSLVVICRDRMFGDWLGFSFTFSKKENRIDGMGNRFAAPPKDVPAEPVINEAAMIKSIKEEMRKMEKNNFFSGAVLIAKNDNILYEGAWGEASKSFHIKNNIDTRFNLGSMNKMFTATAIMQLVEQGKLRLTDTASKFIDSSWLPVSITNRITVHQLLSHTSGLGSFFNETFSNTPRDKLREIDDYKKLLKKDSLVISPGTRFLYSNTGMLLAGVIVEKVSGMSYYDYVRKYIYEPAGMEHTDCYDLDKPQENLAEGYIPDPDGGWKTNTFIHVIRGGPAGGGYSTVTDLYKFARAISTGKLVSDSSLSAMFTPYTPGYGYGFVLENPTAGKIVGHSGGFPGLNSNLSFMPGKGYVIIVMSNYDFGAMGLAKYIQLLVNRVQ